jgi:hypothetical protein
MRHPTFAQLAVSGAIAVTTLALAAGAGAAGGVRPDDRATHGPGAVTVAQHDIGARPGDPGTIPYLSQGAGVDQGLFQGEQTAPDAVQPPQAVTIGRFDWADAGVGALATLGLLLLAAGAAVVALRRRPGLA